MSRSWSEGSTAAWRKIRRVVLARDRWRCQIIGPNCTTVATEVDHIVAKSMGGSDMLSNLRSSCRPCNSSRGDRPDDPEPNRRW